MIFSSPSKIYQMEQILARKGLAAESPKDLKGVPGPMATVGFRRC